MTDSIVLPSEFLEQLHKILSHEDVESFQKELAEPSPTSIRLNPNKSRSPISEEKVPWCSTGYYLDQRPSFTLDPLFHAGAYYVQEPSSMLIEQIIKNQFKPEQELKALDLCAAPGGKSTHLLSLLNKESLLVSNEVIRSRANILAENIQKWGNANVLVTQNDPSDFSSIKGYFDLILVDAPCSGEGLFRKDVEAIKEWSPGHVQHCSLRQKRILSDIFPSLAQNGVMIYCTCTYNVAENEENLLWLNEQNDIDFIRIPNAQNWNVEEINHKGVIGYRMLPHKIKGEGFFLSAFIKRGEEVEMLPRTQKQKSKQQFEFQEKSWIRNHDRFYFQNSDEIVHFYPGKWSNDISTLSSLLNTMLVGTEAGEYKHKKFIPSHALALSTELDKMAVPKVELTQQQAIQFLRKEQMTFDKSSLGFCLVTYLGHGLGWINQLENRYNNLYPTQWRIRMK